MTAAAPPPSPSPSPSPSPLPTTYGWDVVVASRISRINAALIPVSQAFDESVAHPAGAVQATGVLDGATIAQGGSGALVNLALACPSLTLSNAQKSVKFIGGSFLIQARLALCAGSTKSQELKALVGSSAATVLQATFPQPGFVPYETYARAAVQQWLDQQTELPYVFATCAPTASNRGLASVLQPVSTTYAYSDGPDGDGVLGLLCAVAGGADPAELFSEVDPGLVSTQPAVAVISGHVLQQLADGLTVSLGITGSTGAIDVTAPMTLAWNVTGAS